MLIQSTEPKDGWMDELETESTTTPSSIYSLPIP